MTSHTIEFDENDGVVVCRLFGFLDEDAGKRFATDLSSMIEHYRSLDRPLLFLIDNREGRVAAPTAAAALGEKLNAAKRPGDRTAIIVPDSLSKMQAKRVTTSEHEVFLSENAARTWLTAYTKAAPAAD